MLHVKHWRNILNIEPATTRNINKIRNIKSNLSDISDFSGVLEMKKPPID
jgi:hypothetical protein